MPSLIDTHSHIYVDRFADDLDQVIERSREAGVEAIVVPATRPEEFTEVLALAGRYHDVRGAIGVHPHHAAEISPEALQEVERLAGKEKVVAIGEIGLDYHYDVAPPGIQQEVFRQQLRIAKRLVLPAIIHNRESDEDLLRILDEEQDGSLQFQLHCFSSGSDILRRSLELGAMISFTGNITYSKSTLDDIVRQVPDDRIMVETDAPYLSPVPHRGRRNEPGFVALVARKVAELRGQSLEQVKQMTTDNARRFFKLAAFLLILLPCCLTTVDAQTQEPVREVDTTVKPMFDKWFGIGGHLAFSTIITGSTTEVESIGGSGVWGSITPLQSLGIDWLQLDVIYTHVVNTQIFDLDFDTLSKQITPRPATPPNIHNQLDISLRVIGNARNLISFFFSLGATQFHNEYGTDQYILSKFPETAAWIKGYQETEWGLGGSFGLQMNIKTPYALIQPIGEWRVAKILGARTLPKHTTSFFISQPRLGLLIYPDFSKVF